jgi:secreted trypsin-like serine protease
MYDCERAQWDKISTVAGDLEVYRREEGESIKLVKKVHFHEHYEPGTRINDLALLELEGPHVLKPGFVSLATLPSTSDGENDVDNNRPQEGATVMALGWTVQLNNGQFGEFGEFMIKPIRSLICL